MSSDLNRLIGKLEESAKHTEARLNRIEAKLDTLLSDKWKRHGASLVIAGIVSFLATMIIEIAKAKG